MLIVCGALVNGPYALITTAVSADLVRGAPRPPSCLAAPSFPGGTFAGIFGILALFSNAPEAQRRRAALSHLLALPLNTAFCFPYWLHDSALAPLRLPLSAIPVERFPGKSVAIPVLL